MHKNKSKVIIIILIFFVSVNLLYGGSNGHVIKKRPRLLPYPYGKNFAFTVIDDPDSSTIQSVTAVYDLLCDLGFRTTAAVWVKKAVDIEGLKAGKLLLYEGQTCEDPGYEKLMQTLQGKGFEIAMHTVSGGHDLRNETIAGYEKFKDLFGQYPKINIMHSKNKENIYWGRNVFTNSILKWIVGFYDKTPFSGENEKSQYFLGDICKARTKYVRMFGTADINTLKFNPSMPYYDPLKPYVNYWFSFSEGHTGDVFVQLLSDRNIKRLVKERGACIAYTHFGSNFVRQDKFGKYTVRDDVKTQLIKLGQQKEGWFVPASEMLDRLLLLKNISLGITKNALIVSNSNSLPIDGLTLLVKPNTKFYDTYGNVYDANIEGEIVIEKVPSSGVVTLYKDKNNKTLKKNFPGRFEYFSLVYERIKVIIATRFRALKESLF